MTSRSLSLQTSEIGGTSCVRVMPVSEEGDTARTPERVDGSDARTSGRNVRHKLSLKMRHLILQQELALFHSPQLEFVMAGSFGHDLDRDIQVTMLEEQFLDPALNG